MNSEPLPESGIIDPTLNLLLPEVESILDRYGQSRLRVVSTLLRGHGMDNHELVNQLTNDVAMVAGLTGEDGGTRAAEVVLTFSKLISRKHEDSVSGNLLEGVRCLSNKLPRFAPVTIGSERLVGSRRPDWSMDPNDEGYVGEQIAAILRGLAGTGFLANQEAASALRLLPRGVLSTRPNKEHIDVDTGEPLSQAQSIQTALDYAEAAGNRLCYWLVFMDLDGRIYTIAPISLQAADGVRTLVMLPEAEALTDQGWADLWHHHSRWGIRDFADCREIVDAGIVAHHANGGELDAHAHAVHTLHAEASEMYQLPIELDMDFSSAEICGLLTGNETSLYNCNLLEGVDDGSRNAWLATAGEMNGTLVHNIPVVERKSRIKPPGTTISYGSSDSTGALAFVFGKKPDYTYKEARDLSTSELVANGKSKALELIRLRLDAHGCDFNAHNVMEVANEFASDVSAAFDVAIPGTPILQDYLQSVSKCCREEGIAREWTTPMGLTIKVLPYRLSKDEEDTTVLYASINWTQTKGDRRRTTLKHITFVLNDGDLSLMPQLIQSIEAAILQKLMYNLVQLEAQSIWLASAHDAVKCHPNHIRTVRRVWERAAVLIAERFDVSDVFGHVPVDPTDRQGSPVVNPDRASLLSRVRNEMNMCGVPAPLSSD